jgi:hypothetical protein
MYAIEFEADVHNQTIQIPDEYKELESKHIKVFIVDVSIPKKQLPDGFYNPMITIDYSEIPTREEIYDR